jgi:trk system potassium uptake protein TrkA
MTTSERTAVGADARTTGSAQFVVGGGRVGERVADTLATAGESVTLVDQSPRSDLPPGGSAIQVEGLDWETLDAVGLSDATTVIVLGADDATNLLVAHLARSQFDVDRVVARVNDPEREPAFENADVETLDATGVLADAVTEQL